MKRLVLHIFLFLCLSFVLSCAALQGLLGRSAGGITNAEAIQAFKEAMNIGASAASGQLGQTDGYYRNELLKILLPSEAKVILDNIAKIPGGTALLEDVILRINRSAEQAVKDVVPIFASAITEMTVLDGLEIVFGGQHAGTEYLHEKTYDKLVNLFMPHMQACLNKSYIPGSGLSANAAWEKLVQAYDTVAKPINQAARLFRQPDPMPEVTADLGRFTTEKALDGLFSKVAAEEEKIRDIPLAYDSEIVRKVFTAVKERL
ncbi:MAG: DUF4197 domain-containing protein [Spirochaetaceae bacterium]|nr:DUF4197 domain-containing protein [Spirochaetaceae bacterium]